MSFPKFSIITPSYNQGRYLEETLASVIGQNYPNLEYLVIDGGSTDESVSIIKKYEKDIHYWVSEKDNGQSAAINKGLKLATGEIVGWLNSDDMLMPDALQKISSLFSQHPETGMIYGNVENFYTDGRKELIEPPPFSINRFLEKVTIHQPGVFWKRSLHDSIGWLDESLYYLMDYDLWFRIVLNHPSLKADETFSSFRIHPDAKTSGNPEGLYMEYRKVLSAYFNSFGRAELITKLNSRGIYDNAANKKYPCKLSLSPEELEKQVDLYTHQCAIQEYSFQHVRNANKLFLSCLNAGNFLRTLGFIVKNNLRIRSLTSLFR